MFKRYALFICIMLVTSGAEADLRDPTRPGNLPNIEAAAGQGGGETVLHLSAIWISEAGRRATINGDTVTVGQRLPGGSRVLKIGHNYVLIRQNGVPIKIHLVPSVKKR